MANFIEDLIELGMVNEDKYAEVQILLCETAYRKGDKNALFKLLVLCARYQAVIPDWATDEIIKIERALVSGEIKDFNDAFGKQIDVRIRKKMARLNSQGLEIATAMLEHRKDNFNHLSGYSPRHMFEEISENLTFTRRDVEEVYKANKSFFEKVPIDDKFNSYNLVQVKKELPIRRGRKMFKD